MSDPEPQGPREGQRIRIAPQPSAAAAAFGRALGQATPRLYVTYALIAANVLYFVFMVVRGVSPSSPTVASLLDFGANYGPRTTGGQWWRLLSATFIHIGVLHLAMNMWVLLDIGRLVERLLGNLGFFVLYLFAGLTGSIADVLEQEVLPPWRSVRAELDAPHKLPDKQARLVGKVAAYAKARDESWELLARAIRTDDEALVKQANAKQAEADKLAKAIGD